MQSFQHATQFSKILIYLNTCDNEALKTKFLHLDMIRSLRVKKRLTTLESETALGSVLDL